MRLEIGDLRRRVDFYSPQSGDDGAGNRRTSYADAPDFGIAANITPRLGGEQVLAGRLVGTNYANITVRSCASTRAVTTDWLAADSRSGEHFNIRSIIDPDEGTENHGHFIEMLCERGVAL